MAWLIMLMVAISVFVLAFLIDISVNLRRVDGNIKKMIGKYEGVHGTKKT